MGVWMFFLSGKHLDIGWKRFDSAEGKRNHGGCERCRMGQRVAPSHTLQKTDRGKIDVKVLRNFLVHLNLGR